MNTSTLINKFRKPSALAIAAALSILLLGCGNDNDSPEPIDPPPVLPVNYEYSVNVVNLTTGQPLSPIAVVLHNEGTLWKIGTAASISLENLAESGDNAMILIESIVLSAESGAAPIPPGMSETLSISVEDSQPTFISVATMLVNTNDAFSGVNAINISELAVNESITMFSRSYDAGTEKNSELMATIPGPAASGEGFNTARDDVDFVSLHPGIVSKDDGLTQSVLTQEHRFDNPTLSVTITRVE